MLDVVLVLVYCHNLLHVAGVAGNLARGDTGTTEDFTPFFWQTTKDPRLINIDMDVVFEIRRLSYNSASESCIRV